MAFLNLPMVLYIIYGFLKGVHARQIWQRANAALYIGLSSMNRPQERRTAQVDQISNWEKQSQHIHIRTKLPPAARVNFSITFFWSNFLTEIERKVQIVGKSVSISELFFPHPQSIRVSRAIFFSPHS